MRPEVAELLGRLAAEHGGIQPAARATGLCERALVRWKNGHSSPNPRSLDALRCAALGRRNSDAAENEERIQRYAANVAAGLETFTGEARRPMLRVEDLAAPC